MGHNSGLNLGVSRCELDLRRTTLKIAGSLLLLAGLMKGDQGSEGLKGLSLEQLGNIEVTTASKQPVKVSRTAAAIRGLRLRVSTPSSGPSAYVDSEAA